MNAFAKTRTRLACDVFTGESHVNDIARQDEYNVALFSLFFKGRASPRHPSRTDGFEMGVEATNLYAILRPTMAISEKKFDHLVEVVETIAQDLGSLRKELHETEIRLDAKIDRVASRLDKKIDDTKDELVTHIDGLAGQQKRLSEAHIASIARHDRLEEQVQELAQS